MQQVLTQDQLGNQTQQLLHQTTMTSAQQQMVQQSQIAQQQIAQQQLQSQMAQQQLAQQQITQQLAQQQLPQQQMIQQQLLQPQMVQQHIGQQQLQQMMYYPTVRLVYDTPMIMQPGDQIQQQNQNVFANQPPWARPVQNQVIYVQQIGSNLVQHVDPNMFIQQNIPMYQQVVQNVPQIVQNLPQTVQTLPQGQIRQMINTIPAGMVPNFGANVQRIPEQNLGQMVQNFGIVQTNSDVNMNSNVAANVATNESQQANSQVPQQSVPSQEVTQIYRQVAPQINQQQLRPLAPASSQQQQLQPNPQSVQAVNQQIVTNIGQSGANIRAGTTVPSSIGVKINSVRPSSPHVVQNTAPNINNVIRASSPSITVSVPSTMSGSVTTMHPVRHVMPTQNVNMIPQSYQQSFPNAANVPNYTTVVGPQNTVTYSVVRNGQPYTYRAIQPKPNNPQVNFRPRANIGTMAMIRRPVPTVNNQNVASSPPVSAPSVGALIKMETNSPTFNKKRKSESPDEVHKKVSNYGSITVTAQVKDKIKAKYANTSEMGTNTSPVHKPDPSKVESLPLLQINPMEAKIKQEFLSPTATMPNTFIPTNPANQVIKTETGMEVKVKKDSSQQTEEKHVRKTVFPQAKATGRLLDVKPSLSMPILDNINTISTQVSNESVQVKPMDVDPPNKINEQPITTVHQSTNQRIQPDEIKFVHNITQIVHPAPKHTVEERAKISESEKAKQSEACNEKPGKATESKLLAAILSATKDDKCVTEAPKQEVKDSNKETTGAKSIKEPKLESSSGSPSSKSSSNTNVADKMIKTEKPTEIPETSSSEIKPSTDKDASKECKSEKKDYKNIDVSEITGKEIHMVDGNIHKEEKEKEFVLTHVLDGYVIQESNVPFAIRRPLKEKTVNAYIQDKNDPCIKAAKDEIRGQILELSQLHLTENQDTEQTEGEETKENKVEELKVEEEKQEKEDKAETQMDVVTENGDEEGNPFRNLEQSIVKSWTVDSLASHLAKYNWLETVSTLQEHEIDGESLFLVTKQQLVTIGINETHAGVICDFVGSS